MRPLLLSSLSLLFFLVPIAAVVSTSHPASAAAGQAFPFPVKEKTLANGLRVYVVAYDSPGLVAYYSVVRTGSRNEVEPGKSGLRALLRAHDVPRHREVSRRRRTTPSSRRSAPTRTPSRPTT